MCCAEDWLDDFKWVESRDEYHHEDDVVKCPYCNKWELKEDLVYSELIKMDFCSTECRDAAENAYKEKNWFWSEFDQDYYENESEITFYNCWNPELQAYTEKSISWTSLAEMEEKGLMFLFAGEYCDALDPLTNQPYKQVA